MYYFPGRFIKENLISDSGEISIFPEDVTVTIKLNDTTE